MPDSIILLLLFLLFVLLAGLFSGAETGIYQLSRLRLRLGMEHKRLLYSILGSSLRDSSGLLISLLLGTNLANCIATSCITYLVLVNRQSQENAEFIATIIAVPIFFIFSELIPKNLFYYRADQIMPVVSPVIYVFDKLFRLSLLTPLLKGLSHISSIRSPWRSAIQEASVIKPPKALETILTETREEGILSTTQSEMMRRLGHISDMGVQFCMTGLSKTQMVNVKSSKQELLELCRLYPFTRYPVYDCWRNNIIGYINIYDCLADEDGCVNLYGLMKPIHKMSAETSVINAIETMQDNGEKIILITPSSSGKGPLGIVTMKDLVEELLGELTEW